MQGPLADQHENFPDHVAMGHPAHVRVAIEHAATTMIEQVVALRLTRAQIDVSRLRAELDGLGFDRPAMKIAEAELERGLMLLSELERFDLIPGLVAEHHENLWALAQLKVGADPAAAEHATRDLSPELRCRLLARFLWMLEDAKVVPPTAPAPADLCRCRVGRRTTRVRHAEEFYSLLHFLPAFWRATGIELVPVRKHERPDFLVEEAGSRRLLGLEMVEAVEQRANEIRTVCDAWERTLEAELPGKRATLHFRHECPFPRELKRPKVRRAFIDFVGHAIDSSSDGELRKFTFRHGDRELVRFSVKRHDRESGLFFTYPIGKYAWPGDAPERFVAASVVRAVNHKLANKQPEVPTLLVVYPNDPAPAADADKVVEHVRPHLGLANPGAFESLWLSEPTGLWRLDARLAGAARGPHERG